jgi:hypothetical protein
MSLMSDGRRAALYLLVILAIWAAAIAMTPTVSQTLRVTTGPLGPSPTEPHG